MSVQRSSIPLAALFAIRSVRLILIVPSKSRSVLGRPSPRLIFSAVPPLSATPAPSLAASVQNAWPISTNSLQIASSRSVGLILMVSLAPLCTSRLLPVCDRAASFSSAWRAPIVPRVTLGGNAGGVSRAVCPFTVVRSMIVRQPPLRRVHPRGRLAAREPPAWPVGGPTPWWRLGSLRPWASGPKWSIDPDFLLSVSSRAGKRLGPEGELEGRVRLIPAGGERARSVCRDMEFRVGSSPCVRAPCTSSTTRSAAKPGHPRAGGERFGRSLHDARPRSESTLGSSPREASVHARRARGASARIVPVFGERFARVRRGCSLTTCHSTISVRPYGAPRGGRTSRYRGA